MDFLRDFPLKIYKISHLKLVNLLQLPYCLTNHWLILQILHFKSGHLISVATVFKKPYKTRFQYPPIEQSRFSTEIEVSGPNQILYRGADTLNFLLITSRGLISFLQLQHNRNPIMYLNDGVKNQLEMCHSSGELIIVNLIKIPYKWVWIKLQQYLNF